MDSRRAYLRRAYASALARAGDSAAETVGPHSRLPGYTFRDVALLPEQARNSSFGCGNPLAFAALGEGEIVLDVGCGAGVDLLIAASRVAAGGLVIGVDLTVEMLAQANRNAGAAVLGNVCVCQAAMEELPLLGSTVDCVVSNGAIGLSADKDRVFREIARVLRPGGRTIVADITAEEVPSWVRDSPALAASCLAGALSEEALIQAARDAGLDRVQVLQRIELEPEEIAAIVEAELRAYREATGDAQRPVGPIRGAVASTTISAAKSS
jgi:SAM-dependent methyltransferase